jgi:hypothetical protein
MLIYRIMEPSSIPNMEWEGRDEGPLNSQIIC